MISNIIVNDLNNVQTFSHLVNFHLYNKISDYLNPANICTHYHYLYVKYFYKTVSFVNHIQIFLHWIKTINKN